MIQAPCTYQLLAQMDETDAGQWLVLDRPTAKTSMLVGPPRLALWNTLMGIPGRHLPHLTCSCSIIMYNFHLSQNQYHSTLV